MVFRSIFFIKARLILYVLLKKETIMIRHKWSLLNIPLLLMTVLLTIPVVAYAAETTTERPCMDEIKKFCKDIQLGDGGILQCLREHDSKLSASCRDKVKAIVQRVEEAKQNCAKDIEKFCAGIKPGGGRLIKCLKPHIDELTPACRADLQAFAAKASAIKNRSSSGDGH